MQLKMQSNNPENPVNTGAMVYCHMDWMLTLNQMCALNGVLTTLTNI